MSRDLLFISFPRNAKSPDPHGVSAVSHVIRIRIKVKRERSELQFQVVEDIHDLIEEAQNFYDPKHAFMALARLATVTSNASDTGQVGRVVLIQTHQHCGHTHMIHVWYIYLHLP